MKLQRISLIPVNGDPMLFDYQGDFGISEQNDLATAQPDVVAQILAYVQDNRIVARRVNMPEDQ